MAKSPSHVRRPRWLSHEDRRAGRTAVSLPAGVYGRHTERAVVRLLDLTPLGCRILCSRHRMIGAFLTVEIAGVVSVEAWVAWTRANEVGLDFVHPMPPAIIDYLLGIGTGTAAG